MNKQLLKDSVLWGLIMWLIGYVLGIVLFFFVAPGLIGWIITPIGIVLILWVLLKKVKGDSFKYYLILAIAWTLIAIICDYLFLVRVFKPLDGYYKFDVYLYYLLTFILPVIRGLFKNPLKY